MRNSKAIQSVQGAGRAKGAKDSCGDKFGRLVDVLQEMIDKEFTGHVKINFSQGGIGRIEKFEEILKGSLPD